MPFPSAFRAAVALAASLIACPALSQGDAWPAKPLRVIVAYPAGGTSDAVVRQLA